MAQSDKSNDDINAAISAWRLRDPMKEYQEAMKALELRDPMKEYREAMKALELRDPMKEYREALASIKLRDPLLEAREAMKALQLRDPMREYREALASIQFGDPLREARDAINALQLHDPMKAYRESLAAIQLRDPLREVMKAWKNHDPAAEYRNSLSAARDALKSLGIGSIPDAVAKYDALAGHVGIDQENSLVVDGRTIRHEEIQSLVNEITNKALDTSVVRIEQALAVIVSELKALQSSPLQRAMTLLFLPILIALIMAVVNPIADYYIKESLGARKTEATVKKEILSAVEDRAALEPFRLIIGKSLNVRVNPSAQSPIIGKLHVGQVVRLIEKRKDWSRVVWADDELGTVIQGWVFSRYLGKFR